MSDRSPMNGSKERPETMPADLIDDRQSASRYSVPALEKGLEILELLAQEPTGLSGTQIANRLGRSTGEIYRIIQYLEWRGYLERDRESDLYSLTMRMFRLSHEHPPLRSLVASAVPLMEALAAEIGQSCHLAVMDRTAIVIVAQIDSPLPIRYSVRLGAQFPIWETSSGFLIAAHLPASTRDLLMAQLAHIVDEAEIEDFKGKIDEIAKAGHEVRTSLMIPGITNLCRPVFGHNGQILAALTVPFMAQRSNPASVEQADAALAVKAEALSSALGYSPT